MSYDSEPIRLQKFLSLAGVTSRRKAEQLMLEGRVFVNGRAAKELGTKVIPGRSRVEVDGKPVRWRPERVYILLNKPTGYLTSLDDPTDRPLVIDLLPRSLPRVYPVGRLDWDSEGALIFTNDGTLAHALMHPSRNVPRVYHIKVKGELTEESRAFKQLREGITLDDGPVLLDRVSLLRFTGKHTWLECQLHVGRNRILRRVGEAIGHPVLRLRRMAYGPVALQDLKEGAFRDLRAEEVSVLYKAVQLEHDLPPRRERPARKAKEKRAGRRVSNTKPKSPKHSNGRTRNKRR